MNDQTSIGATEKLARFACAVDFESLPADAKHQAKRCLLDTLSAIIAGSDEKLPSVLNEYYRQGNPAPRGEATVILSNLNLSAPNAALVNGAKAHSLDFDDGHRFAAGHPGAVVVPAALAAGDLRNSNGKEIISAIIAGYEVFIRIGSAINPSHLRRGFHTTGTCGTIGAAAAAGRILRLDATKMENALALATIQGAGLLRVVESGAEAKPFQVGRASQAGVLAAILAEKGIQGPKNILEGTMGFVDAMTDHCDYNVMLDDLGDKYSLLQTYVKLYPVCRHIHAAIDGALTLKSERGPDNAEIASVLVETYRTAVDLTGTIHKPESIPQARFSLPFAVAIALIKDNFVEAFSRSLHDPDVNRLAGNTNVIVDQKWDKIYPNVRGMTMHIRLKNGRELQCRIEIPKGEPENPVSDQELEQKFIGSASGKICQDKIKPLIDMVMHLEKLPQLSELMRALA